jgi:hypothetical protein
MEMAEHKGTERSKRIVVNRQFKEVDGKLVSVNRKATGSAHGQRDKNTRFRIGSGLYGFNSIRIEASYYRNPQGRKEVEWHIKDGMGKTIKKADTLGIAWLYVESNHRV